MNSMNTLYDYLIHEVCLRSCVSHSGYPCTRPEYRIPCSTCSTDGSICRRDKTWVVGVWVCVWVCVLRMCSLFMGLRVLMHTCMCTCGAVCEDGHCTHTSLASHGSILQLQNTEKLLFTHPFSSSITGGAMHSSLWLHSRSRGERGEQETGACVLVTQPAT